MKTELSAYRFTSVAWDRSLTAGTDQDWSVPTDLTRPAYLTNLDSGCAFVKPTIDDTLIRMDASMAMFMGDYFDVKLCLPVNVRKMMKENLRYGDYSPWRYNQVGEEFMPTVISGDADLGALSVIQNYNQYYELQDYFVQRPGHVVYTPPDFQDLMKAEGPKFTRDLSAALLDYAEYDDDGNPYLKTLLSYQTPGLLMHSGKRTPGPNTHGPNGTSQDVSPTRLNYVFPFTSIAQNDREFERLRVKYDYEDPQITATWSNRGYTDANQDIFFWSGMEDSNPELITSKAKGEVWVLYSNNGMNFVIACPAFDYYGIKEIKNPQYPTLETADVDVYVVIRTQLGGNQSRIFGKKMSLGFTKLSNTNYGGQLSGNGNPPFRLWSTYVNKFEAILPGDMVSVTQLSRQRSGLKRRWDAGHAARIGWDTQDARTSFSVRLAGVHFVFKWRHPLISQGESQSKSKSSVQSDDSDDVDRGLTTKTTTAVSKTAVSKTLVSKSLTSDTTTTRLLSKTIKFIKKGANTIKHTIKRFLTVRRRVWQCKYRLLYRF